MGGHLRLGDAKSFSWFSDDTRPILRNPTWGLKTPGAVADPMVGCMEGIAEQMLRIQGKRLCTITIVSDSMAVKTNIATTFDWKPCLVSNTFTRPSHTANFDTGLAQLRNTIKDL